MVNTEDGYAFLQTISKISCALGFFGVILTIQYLVQGRIKLETPLGKLTLILWITDFHDTLVKLLGNTPAMPTQTNQVLCYFQGIEGTFASNVDVTTNFVVGIWSFYIFYVGGKSRAFINNQPLMVICIYAFSFLMAIIPLMVDKPDLYTGVIWCWISTAYPGYQFYTLFLWMWIVIPFNIISLGFTWYYIQKRRMGNRIVIRLFTYLIAFLMVWLPVICYRISFRLFNSAPFELTVLEYIMIPLRGLLHYFCLVISLNVKVETNVDEQPIPQGLSLVSGSRSHRNILSSMSLGSRLSPSFASLHPSVKDEKESQIGAV